MRLLSVSEASINPRASLSKFGGMGVSTPPRHRPTGATRTAQARRRREQGSWWASTCLNLVSNILPSGRRPVAAATADRQNFGKMLFVFGWIATDLCNQIRVFQHVLRSARLYNRDFEILATLVVTLRRFCNVCRIFAEF